MSNSGLTVGDIAHVAALLRHRLPDHLVPLILEHVWIPLARSRTSYRRRIGSVGSGVIVLRFTLPKGTPASYAHRVQIRITSGETAPPKTLQDRTTDKEGRTWFEVGVHEDKTVAQSQVQVQESVQNGELGTPRSLSMTSHRWYCDGSWRDPVQRRRVITNLCGIEEWRTHTVIWNTKHEDGDIRETVRKIKGGDTIELSMFAPYRDWENHLSSASIVVECNAGQRFWAGN